MTASIIFAVFLVDVYDTSCIKRRLQRQNNSGKCPQCNRKCIAKDLRKLYASRVVVVDEESHKKIQPLEAKCASLEHKGADWCKEARILGHNFVGTEQILLGLIGEGIGIAAKVLKSMVINLKESCWIFGLYV